MRILFLAITFFAVATLQAQTKPAAKPVGKAPIVTASIGKLGQGTYSIALLKTIVDSALVLKDAKGVKYSIDKCSFLYKRKLTHKDDETGKTSTTWEYAEKILKNGAQLDAMWKTTIKSELKKGEQLIFSNILADSKRGFKIPVATIILTAE
jgi:hypothetical protein